MRLVGLRRVGTGGLVQSSRQRCCPRRRDRVGWDAHHNNEGGCHRGQRRPRGRANGVWSRVTPLRFPLSVRKSHRCGVDVIQDFEVEIN